MRYLLDTNVVSERVRGRPNERVLRWLAAKPSNSKFVSVLTIGEMRRGVELLRRRDPPQVDRLERWVEDTVEAFGDRVFPVDRAVVERWASLGILDPVPHVASLIAATALVHGLTVATRNMRDFERCGVQTVDPFEG